MLLAILLVLVIYNIFFYHIKEYRYVSTVTVDDITLSADQVVNAVLIVGEEVPGEAEITLSMPTAVSVIKRMSHASISQTFKFTVINRKTVNKVTIDDNATINIEVAANHSQTFTGMMISNNSVYVWPVTAAIAL